MAPCSLSACGPRGRSCPSARDRFRLPFSGTRWPQVAVGVVRTRAEWCPGLALCSESWGQPSTQWPWCCFGPRGQAPLSGPQSCDPVWPGSSDGQQRLAPIRATMYLCHLGPRRRDLSSVTVTVTGEGMRQDSRGEGGGEVGSCDFPGNVN